MNNKEAVRQFTIDISGFVNQIIASLPFMDDYKPGNKIHWDTRFLYDYARAIASDAFVKSLNSGIPGLNSSLTAPDLKEKAFEPFIDYFNDRWNFPMPPLSESTPEKEVKRISLEQRKANTKRLKDIMLDIDKNLNEIFLDLENYIFSVIGRPTYDLWETRLDRESGDLIATLVGDFRIIEWEHDHLDEKGYYVSVVTMESLNNIDVSEIVDEVVQKFHTEATLTSKPLAGKNVVVLGFNNQNVFEYTKESMKCIVNNLGGHAHDHYSSEADVVVLSSAEDLLPKEVETFSLCKRAGLPVISNDELIKFFATSKIRKERS